MKMRIKILIKLKYDDKINGTLGSIVGMVRRVCRKGVKGQVRLPHPGPCIWSRKPIEIELELY